MPNYSRAARIMLPPKTLRGLIWNRRVIDAFLQITTYFGSLTFLAIQYDQVGSPPAHRQQISHSF